MCCRAGELDGVTVPRQYNCTTIHLIERWREGVVTRGRELAEAGGNYDEQSSAGGVQFAVGIVQVGSSASH